MSHDIDSPRATREPLPAGPAGTRRNFIRGAAALAAGGAVPFAAGAAEPATTPTTIPSPTDKLTAADVKTAANRVLGRAYTDAECEMMAGGVTARRGRLQEIRRYVIDPAVPPAASFDPRLPGHAYPSGDSSFKLSEPAKPLAYDGNPASLAFASAADLSRLLHAGRVTSVALTQMYLDRLDTIGRKLNAVVTLTRELAMKQAVQADAELKAGKSRGPLHGIPYGAKDLLATTGIPTTWGVKPLADQVFDYDGTVVERLAAAGAVLLAKLSLGELAMGDVWFGGMTRNPWKPATGSSGSSAGPGAATAAGLVGFSVGSETLGSIVSPSITNGVTGLRPTYGRVSRFGAMSLAYTLDKLGPMCRSVEDCAMVLSAIHGPDAKDATAAAGVPFRWDPAADLKSLRVGVDAAAFEAAAKGRNAGRRAAVAAALDEIKKLVADAGGGELKPITLPPADRYAGLANLFIACESAASFAELLEDGRVRELVQQDPGSWPNTFRQGSLVPAADYLRAMRLRTELMRAMAAALADVDLYVTVPYQGPTIAFTNLTGHPSLVTRCGLADGMPVSVEFVGQLYREDAILRLGHAYERATAWHKQWPGGQRGRAGEGK